MKIQVENDFSLLQDAWQALQPESIFSTWAWCSVWWKHFHDDGELLLLTAREDDGKLIGIAPLMIVRGKWSLKQVQFIGSSAPVEHFDFIIQRGREADVIAAFMRELRAYAWDVLRLDNILPHSPTLDALKSLPVESAEDHVAPYIQLPADLDTLLGQQSKRTREKHRRYRRKIDKDFPGRWSCVTAKTPHEIDAVFDELVTLHQQHWVSRGEAGAFADPRMTAFYRDLAHEFAKCGWLRLYRLCADNQPVSIDLAFAYHGRFYHFINGTDFHSVVESPGIVLHSCMIEASIAEGLREYDFMWGEEPYKYDWGAQRRADHTLTWYATPRAKVIHGTVSLLKAGKRRLRERTVQTNEIASTAGSD